MNDFVIQHLLLYVFLPPLFILIYTILKWIRIPLSRSRKTIYGRERKGRLFGVRQNKRLSNFLVKQDK